MPTTLTPRSGSRTTHGGQSNIIPVEVVDSKLAPLTESASAFTFVAKAKKTKPRGTLQPKVGEDLLLRNVTFVATAYAAAATTIYPTSGTEGYAKSRDIIVNKTKGGGRHIVVSVDTTSHYWTVSANVDNGTSTAGEVGDELLILGPAIEQGGPYPQTVLVDAIMRTFYMHRHSTAVNFTDEAIASGSYFSPDDYPYQKKKAFMIKHVLDRDMKAWWSGKGRAVTMPGTVANYTPAGVANQLQVPWGFFGWHDEYADTDHKLYDPALTEAELIKNMRQMFFAEYEPQHSSSVLMFHAPELAEGIMLWNIGRVRFEGRVQKKGALAGLSFTDWQTSYGPVAMRMVEHFSARASGGKHRYTAVNLKHIGWVPHRSKNGVNMDTHIEQDVVKDGYHRRIDEITEVGCMWFRQPNAHVVGTFLTTE